MTLRAALFIDGGFLLQRLASVRPDVDPADPVAVDRAIGQLVHAHLDHIRQIEGGADVRAHHYRSFFYDAAPYHHMAQLPVSGRNLNYDKTPQAQFRRALHVALRKRSNMAVRLGTVRLERSWVLNERAQKDLLRGARTVADLMDEDFTAALRQKGVDMRFGLDVASVTLKRQANVLILVTGDSDFVPAAKLARREGAQVILDPLWASVSDDLHEHIDQLRSGFARPRRREPAP
jgi:uncharacterized LabA/DUF88 family protein